jgi:hypothetical protein
MDELAEYELTAEVVEALLLGFVLRKIPKGPIERATTTEAATIRATNATAVPRAIRTP